MDNEARSARAGTTRKLEGIGGRPRRDVSGRRPVPADAPLAIGHNLLRDALAATFEVPRAGAEALGARLKALLGMGLRRNGGKAPGRGRGHRNGLLDALEAALAIMLQRAFVPPSAAVAMIVANRAALDEGWAAAARGDASTITVAIDALSHAGREGTRTGRFSEDPTGSVTLLAHASERRARGVPPPHVAIDLRLLFAAVTDALRHAGVDRAGLREAEGILGCQEER